MQIIEQLELVVWGLFQEGGFPDLVSYHDIDALPSPMLIDRLIKETIEVTGFPPNDQVEHSVHFI